MCKEMKSHEEFVEEVKEATREPTLAEQTHDALSGQLSPMNPELFETGEIKEDDRDKFGKREQ